MSNDEVTTVAADFMYLVILGDQDIIDNLAVAMNVSSDNNRAYVSVPIDKQIDYLPETDEFQMILRYGMSAINRPSDSDAGADVISNDSDDTQKSSFDKYFRMGEGVETAQCYTCGEGYVNANMLLEIEEETDSFAIRYPILNLDDEVNPEDLISSWIINNKVTHVIDNLNVRLVTMVGTEHDILVFAAYVNK